MGKTFLEFTLNRHVICSISQQVYNGKKMKRKQEKQDLTYNSWRKICIALKSLYMILMQLIGMPFATMSKDFFINGAVNYYGIIYNQYHLVIGVNSKSENISTWKK